jgi:hypothetical protein
MRTVRHQFLRKYPIVLVNNLDNWAGGSMVSESYFQLVRFKGRPLSYVIIEATKARETYGRFDESIVGATMAMIGGGEKYPNNPKLAMKWALGVALEYRDRGSFDVLRGLYERKFGKCEIGVSETDWKTPHQTDDLSDQTKVDSEFDRIVDMMDDEAEQQRGEDDEEV